MEGKDLGETPVDEPDGAEHEEIPEDTVTGNPKMAATPGPGGTKRPLSLSPSTEEDKAENLKQGKNIVVSPPMTQNPKRRGIGENITEMPINIDKTGNDSNRTKGKSCSGPQTNMANLNNNIDPNDSGIAPEGAIGGEKAQCPVQNRPARRASLRGQKPKGTVNPEDTGEGDGASVTVNTSDTVNSGDDGSSTKPDMRGENQGGSTKMPVNRGDLIFEKLHRGRPRSRTTSVDRTPKAQDIYSLLLEIKDKQDTGQSDIELLNTKIGSMQQNLDVNLGKLNDKTTEIDLQVQNLKGEFSRASKQVDNLENRANKIECEIQNQSVKLEEVNEKCADRVSQVEYELAADIETVKNNIEEQMAYEKQTQMQLENRLANFVKEMESENCKMKVNLRELQDNLDNLKMQNSETSTTASSTTDHSAQSTFSQFSENEPNDANIYMYGDVSRSLILDGIRERATRTCVK